MAQAQVPQTRGRKRRMVMRGLGIAALLLAMALVVAWFTRREIAHDLIGDALGDAGVEASYTVEQISPGMQVLRDVVVGDPARPDFTAERVEIDTTLRLGLPGLRQVRVFGPRIYGSFRDGRFSFGALDPLIFTDDEEPFALPDIDLAITDGRGLIESDYGRIGLKLAGEGHLQDGFAGEIAAVSPTLTAGGCKAVDASLYGKVSIADQQPFFDGPLRFARLECGAASVADGVIEVKGSASRDFAAFEGDVALRSGALAVAGSRARSLRGEGAFGWQDGTLTSRYGVALAEVVTAYASFAELALEGRANAVENFAEVETEGDARGKGVRLGVDFDAQLARAERASAGSMAAPLLARLHAGLTRELSGASLATSYNVRHAAAMTSVVLPQASLRGASGASVLALSRAELVLAGQAGPRLSGNFSTGGQGLPRIIGRMEQARGGPLTLRMRMAEYAAGDARLAMPDMALTQSPSGAITLRGSVLASGQMPGGFANGLAVPVDGVIGADGSAMLWQGCRDVRFDRLRLANLTLARQSLRLCPVRGAPMLAYGRGGLRIAAGAASLNLRGSLGDTPIVLASGPVGFAWPGTLATRDLAVTLGPADTATRFVVSNLTADLSAANIGGQFAGVDVTLAAVPLDITGAGGDWRYADGRLDLTGASFLLADREEVDRFKPMEARGGSLSLADNRITANAMLYETRLGTAVARMQLSHDLNDASGNADLVVDGMAFTSRGLQPRDLSERAYGVVSMVEGMVSGSGRIVWDDAGVQSRGAFTTNRLDFAAPFGPVEGASGTVEFTDLLGLTTAPDQRFRIAAINPGIEILGGEIGFQMLDGQVIQVTGGEWPFLGGILRMQPVTLNMGVAETRTYVIEIEGLEAARFVERMELNNLAAEGMFDGTIPIVFDEMGNGRLAGGVLVARPPGGRLSYIGQLTYEDMGFFSNLAFSALRDLRFSAAEIRLDGPLTGELVTKVNFEGIGQGETATSNLITRQIARLPILLRINIRAPFYQLISTTRSLYDPAAVRDPRGLGLITADGTRLRATIDGRSVEARDAAAAAQSDISPEPDIQPPESEALP